jgi:hypothetical protein
LSFDDNVPQSLDAMPYRVFFSHGGDDTYVVEEFLKPKVESSGATVFVDSGTIDFGDDFRKVILAQLSSFDELLVLLTPSSLRRPWVFAEVAAAVFREKRIVAVTYGPTESELQALGVLSLLGTKTLLKMNEFDKYVMQLAARVKANGDA